MKPKSLTLDNSTWASNPARSRVNFLRHAWYYPKWPLIWAALLAGSALSIALGRPSFPLFVILGFIFLYLIRIKEFFKHGDANPGIVVQLNPTLVAVLTDLTRGVGCYPAIKVFRTRLRKSMGQPLALGTFLPTISLYRAAAERDCPHWEDFDPRPLECATADRKSLDRVMGSFTEEQFRRLESAVQSLPEVAPGLYKLSKRGWEKA
jgi:hypothetical protein